MNTGHTSEYYQNLLPYVKTNKQREILTQLVDNPNQAEIARQRGQLPNKISDIIRTVKRYAAESGGITTVGAPGYMVKGESRLLDSEGNTKLVWQKTDTNKELMLQELVQTITAEFEAYKGLSVPVPAPQHNNEDLLCMIPIGDEHVGVLAWGEETGEDFDMEIA